MSTVEEAVMDIETGYSEMFENPTHVEHAILISGTTARQQNPLIETSNIDAYIGYNSIQTVTTKICSYVRSTGLLSYGVTSFHTQKLTVATYSSVEKTASILNSMQKELIGKIHSRQKLKEGLLCFKPALIEPLDQRSCCSDTQRGEWRSKQPDYRATHRSIVHDFLPLLFRGATEL